MATLEEQVVALGISKQVRHHPDWEDISAHIGAEEVLVAAGVSDTRPGGLCVITHFGLHRVLPRIFGPNAHVFVAFSDVADARLRLLRGGITLTLSSQDSIVVPELSDGEGGELTDLLYAIVMGHLWRPVLDRVLDAHAATLARKRRQLLVKDEFGVTDRSAWEKELDRVYERVLFPGLSAQEVRDGDTLSLELCFPQYVDAWLDERGLAGSASKMTWESPVAFEHHCAEVLTRAGWIAHVNGRSGDQGVDVVGERNDVRLALQCKLYSAPVGNDAVQQIIAGMVFHEATRGAVVSNATFTPSAQSLAARAGITLLHVSALADFARDDLEPRVIEAES